VITLYERTDCPFCWKVRLALAELGLGYRIVATHLGEKHPDVQRLSPTGTVPVMVDGDISVWESGVVLDYLDARYSPGSLFPTDPGSQTQVRLLHAYSDKCIGPALRALVFEKRSKPREDWDTAVIESSEAAWLECQGWLENNASALSSSGCWLTAAECAIAARCGVAEAYGAAVRPEFPSLYDWYQAVKWRPAWDAAFPRAFPGKTAELLSI
jgi:glutathione S-transferase